MTKATLNFKQFLQDPILSRIIFLAFSAAILTMTATGTEVFIHRLNEKQAQLVHNEQTHWLMGKIIIRKLLLVQQDMIFLQNATNSKDIATYHQFISAELGRIQKILKLFRTGGSFVDIMPANMPQKHKLAEIHSYTPPPDKGYIIEELELTPQIIQIKNNINDIQSLAMQKVSPGMPEEIKQKAAKKIRHLTAITQTLIKRARTNSSRIYFDSLSSINLTRQQTLKTIQRWHNIRLLLIGLMLTIGVVILLKTIKQIAIIIDDNKRYSASLAQTTSTLEQIIETLPVGVLIIEKGFIIRHMNTAAAQMLEISNPDSIKGTKCTQIFCHADKKHCPLLDIENVKTPKEIQIKCATGKTIPVIKNSMTAQIGDDKVILETFINITERKNTEILQNQYQRHLEQEVNKRTKDLQELNDKLLTQQTSPTNKYRELSTAVIEQIQQQLALMQNHTSMEPLEHIRKLCNAYACLQEHKNGTIKQPVDLNVLLGNITIIAKSIWSPDVTINFTKNDVPCFVNGIYHYLAQAFVDIIHRATDTTGATNTTISIQINSDNGFYKVQLHDNGPCMGKETQDEIFNNQTGPLFDAYHKIVNQHDGKLMFSSTPEHGTTFFVKLPIFSKA